MGVNEPRRITSPVDPDSVALRQRPIRPVHLRWSYLGLVWLGGTLGTCLRYLLELAVPAWRGLPLATFSVNVLGAFVLGALIEGMARSGPDTGARRAWRLFAGTGLLGGFTTYSSFAVDADGLLRAAQLGSGLVYVLATIVVGAAASLAGIAVGALLHRLAKPQPRSAS